ncbi:SPASM domain-containing protein [Enterococcus villorum]|nr:SPASM domain-containing protein [Enterococcus villorum]
MIPASPVGNAKQIDKGDLYLKDVSEHNLDCPSSWEMVIHHDGYVYPCCSLSIFEPYLIVGNVRVESLG